jgi:single-stranded-DNA-specific exonuclease
MAAGLSLAEDQLAPAMRRLGEILGAAGAGADPPRSLRLDGLLAPGAATIALAERIAAAGPYGAGAPAPRLAVSARLAGVRRIGSNHLALALADRAGGRLDAVAFRAADDALGGFLAARVGTAVHVAGRLEHEVYGGRERVKLLAEDAAAAD